MLSAGDLYKIITGAEIKGNSKVVYQEFFYKHSLTFNTFLDTVSFDQF